MAKGPSKVDLIARVPLFSACTKKELHAVAQLADVVRIAEGETLTREGRPGREFFAISDGKAKVTLNGRRIATLERGDFFGEMALIDPAPRAATVTAETSLTAYVVSEADFGRLLEDAPSVARKMLKSLAGRLRKAQKSPTY